MDEKKPIDFLKNGVIVKTDENKWYLYIKSDINKDINGLIQCYNKPIDNSMIDIYIYNDYLIAPNCILNVKEIREITDIVIFMYLNNKHELENRLEHYTKKIWERDEVLKITFEEIEKLVGKKIQIIK